MEALPETDPASERQRWKRRAIVGAVLLTGPMLGFMGAIAGMLMSFQAIESSRAPTPNDLAQGVTLSLFATVAGLLLGGFGAVLLLVALLRLNGLRPGRSPGPASEPRR